MGANDLLRARSYVAIPEVAAKIKPLRPKIPRKHTAALKVQPQSNRYMLIGTAFDYLLRFELQRRVPHAVTETWIAETALGVIHRTFDTGSATIDLFADSPPEDRLSPEEVVTRIRSILREAKAVHNNYLTLNAPSAAQQAELAAHAIRLAKLDSIVRAMKLEPTFDVALTEDVQELVDLLSVVPSDFCSGSKILFLNPTFGQASQLIGGADADIIADDCIVDIKTTKKQEFEGTHLDQLLSYLILSRKHRTSEPSFPEIKRLGFYLARHGHLWTIDATAWTNHPDFPAVEKWFFEYPPELSKRMQVK